MNLVKIAMRRPFMIIVLVIALGLAAVVALRQMPRDIFPDMGVPTIYVAQPYGGMDPAQMEGYIVNYYEYHFLYINGIEHVESKSIQGTALIKLQFHPGTNMAQAMAETIGYINRAKAFMPAGTVPPFAMRFDAGSVPVGNLVFTSDKLSLGELQYQALFRVRPIFATLPGVSAPPPFGGSQRTVVIKVDPERLRAYNMAPEEVVAAISATNTITPSGNVNLGTHYPMVSTNAIVTDVKELEAVPIRTGSTQTVFLRDIGTVEDGSDIQTAYALVNGRRTVYIPVTKRSDASTLAVVDLVKRSLPKFQAVVSEGVTVSYAFDQSPYVTRAIGSLLLEILLGALLTGMMILLFLRDWRSATIVIINIPISLLAAALALWISNQTINIMTLGGLALAVGILVDEATVSIENIHTHLTRGKSLARAALDATTETTIPRLLAMLSILAVFIPSLFMVGAARSLFVPLSLAVGFAMVASYLLSSTLVPILSVWLLKRHAGEVAQEKVSIFQAGYARLAQWCVRLRWLILPAYLAVTILVVLVLGRSLGTEIFPAVDAGQFQLRLRAPTGTRIDETEKFALKTLDVVKEEVGAQNVEMSLGFVGVHASSYPINTIHLWTGGPEEAVLQVQLKRGTPVRIQNLQERLRRRLAAIMPQVRTSFEPSDIVSRVMSFGAATPVEVAVTGPDLAANQGFAEKVKDALSKIGSLRDLQFAEALDYPTIKVNVDRERAGLMGMNVADVSRSVVTATYSSRFVTPIYWADPKTGIGFQVQVQIPQTQMTSLEDIQNIPITRKLGSPMLLRDLASVSQGTAYGQIDRYNMQRSITLNANIVGEDLGRVARKIASALESLGAPPAKVTVAVRGQITPMQQMLSGLQVGFLLAIVVIFLLLSANFQSFKLSLIVVSTLPAVVAGIVVALWVSRTTLNLQSFMGAIMAVGVAVANAILLVTFAERHRMQQGRADEAAVEGARSRLRPILMTSMAMIAGMMPMALGLGEGGEQTAPLGRAVIGGLAAATLATLFVLPGIFTIIRGRSTTQLVSIDPDDPGSAYYEPASAPDGER